MIDQDKELAQVKYAVNQQYERAAALANWWLELAERSNELADWQEWEAAQGEAARLLDRLNGLDFV
jgi:hypothetical protein